ncbi:predicted protein [Naegleria gruberi]|uniref:Predicted protein n=1 Tax=Naegleria gruberi TaxID=5762 RepID=D2VKJ4_NAEGR|nr:uncharacterized protein NAEGRDRAFT_69414 [Naegleria gruberi]EFC42606.1 predicted protein [Naegleria gruberi]|eukprot:XP_002675350.1 predicted protein [Naegleria gruberi strain NEG-M]
MLIPHHQHHHHHQHQYHHQTVGQQQQFNTSNLSPNLMQDKTPEKMVCGIILNNWKSRHNTKLLMRKALNDTDSIAAGSIFKSADIGGGTTCLGIQKKKKTLDNKGKFKFHQYQAPHGNGFDSFYSNTLSCSAQSDVKKVNNKALSLTHIESNKQSVNSHNSPYIEKQVVFKFATLPHQTASHHVKSVSSTVIASTNMYTSCGTSSTSSSTTSSSNTSSQLNSRSNQLIMDDDYNNHYQRVATLQTAPINSNNNNNQWWNSFELPQINSCHQATTTTSSEPLPSFSQLINTLGI